MNRVLITGGAGFIGSHTADLLISKGYNITILDSLNSKTHNSGWPAYLDERCNLVQGDVLDEHLMKSLISNTDYIIHLAAEMDLNPDFKKFIDVNVGSTALIYEIIHKNNFNVNKVIVASSQFVYGDGIWECHEHGKFQASTRTNSQMSFGTWDILCSKCNKKANYLLNTEESQNPPNHYALSKYFQEQLAITLGKLYGIPSVALRYSIVHGPRQSLKNSYSGALRTFAISILNGLPLSTFEDNETKRDFISVFDVAEANVLVLESEKADYSIFNVGGDKFYTAIELAQMLSLKLNLPYSFNSQIEYRVGDIRNAISDSSKLKAIGWSPKYSEDQTLQFYVDWFMKEKIDLVKFLDTQKLIRELGIVKRIKS